MQTVRRWPRTRGAHWGDSGNDSLYGEDGNDIFDGGAGDDVHWQDFSPPKP